MHRHGSLASLVLTLLAAACPGEQVNPGGSFGTTTTAGPMGVSTAEPTTMALPTSSGAPTGSSGTSSGGGAGTSTSTSTGTDEGSGTAAGGSSSSTGDSGVGGTGSTGEPPKLVDCFGCLCDINVSFCRIVFAGVQAVAFAGPGAQCPIVEADSQESGCVLYPPRCGEAPSCECLPTMNGGCFCTVLAAGDFQVVCPLP